MYTYTTNPQHCTVSVSHLCVLGGCWCNVCYTRAAYESERRLRCGSKCVPMYVMGPEGAHLWMGRMGGVRVLGEWLTMYKMERLPATPKVYVLVQNRPSYGIASYESACCAGAYTTHCSIDSKCSSADVGYIHACVAQLEMSTPCAALQYTTLGDPQLHPRNS